MEQYKKSKSIIWHNIYYSTFLLEKPSILAVLLQKLKSIMGKKKSLESFIYKMETLRHRIWFVDSRLEIVNFKIKACSKYIYPYIYYEKFL